MFMCRKYFIKLLYSISLQFFYSVFPKNIHLFIYYTIEKIITLMSGKAVGIDLGTSYSCVGVWQNDRVEIIANDQGNRTTPSYVAFTDTELIIGDAAKSQAAMNPYNTV